MKLLEKQVQEFKFGTITEVEKQSIPSGAASDSLNWLTQGDRIELRRGHRLLGADAGAGKVTGISVGIRQDGTEVLFRTRGRKVEYYDSANKVWTEIGSNTLPSDADGEDIAFSPYNSLTGSAMYLSSPNSSIYKIMVANPGSITDLLSTDHRGRIKIRTSRMHLWNRKGTTKVKDETALYRSKIDKDEVSDFTAISAEAIGASGSTNYTGTLAFKAAGAKRTCFLVRFTDGTQTLYDDKNGGFTGDGTGTINYTTGEYNITFNSATTGSVTADYYWEDSTSSGIADFSYSATRTAGQGYVLRQDDGGGQFQNLGFFGGSAFAIHERRTWEVTESVDDLDITNLIYRDKVGISNWRAMAETGEGIYYIDDTEPSTPRLRLLTLEPVSSLVVPVSISDNLTLEDYRFDQAATETFGDFVLFACRHKNSSFNNTLIAYNRRLKSLDRLDYNVSCMAVYGGALVAGDSLTNNVYELFSGVDDADSTIPNYWIGNLSRLDVDELKKVKKLRVQGTIGPDQSITVSLSLDRGGFVEIGTIEGDGSYVDRGQAVNVGSQVLGEGVVGGGSDGVVAYNYFRELSVRQGKFDEVQIKFEATELGWASVSMYSFFNILPFGQRIPTKYRT